MLHLKADSTIGLKSYNTVLNIRSVPAVYGLLLPALLFTLWMTLLSALPVADGLADRLAIIVGYLPALPFTLILNDLHRDGQQ